MSSLVVSSSFSKSVESKIRQRSKFSTPIQLFCIGVQILHAITHSTSVTGTVRGFINSSLLSCPLPPPTLVQQIPVPYYPMSGMICDLDDDICVLSENKT